MLNKTFPIVYQDVRYLVDPSYLINSSLKFHDLITPFQQNGYDIENLHLKINYDKFTERNVNNFLKLCHNQQTDVLNSEIKEICLIAKLFRADAIYKTGITFIQKSIDPNFVIPDNLFNEENGTFLMIEFEESNDAPIQEDTSIQTSPLILLAPSIQTAPIVKLSPEIQVDEAMKTAPTRQLTSYESITASIHHVYDLNELEFDESIEREKKINNSIKRKKIHSVVYKIQVEKPLMKCKRYLLIRDGQVICSAKQKDNEIVISEGKNVHIKNDDINSARITQNREGFNIIIMNDQDIKISYVPIGLNKNYSLEFSFIHKTTKLTWSPKDPKKSTSFNGEYSHIPLRSKKNIILQNTSGHPTFILRKMKKMEFEAECHPGVSPLVVFSTSLSQIVGPYNP